MKNGHRAFFLFSFSGATSRFAEPKQSSTALLYVPSSCSKPKIKVTFAPTAEAKKASKASRQAEDTTRPLLAAKRTACKNWLSFIFPIVTLFKDFSKV